MEATGREVSGAFTQARGLADYKHFSALRFTLVVHVFKPSGIVVASGTTGCAGGRVRDSHIHHLSRLRPRFVF